MSIEAMKQALEALEQYASHRMGSDLGRKAITALRTAIEQAEKQEPVAWYDSESGITDFHSFKPVRKPSSPTAEWIPLYTTPPVQEFVCSAGFCRFTLTQTGVGINVPDEEKRKK